MSKSITGDPPDSATFIAYAYLYHGLKETRQELIRLNPMVSVIRDGGGADGRKRWKLPVRQPQKYLSDFLRLKEIEMDATVDEDVTCILRFCDLWLQDEVRNQPIRLNPDFEPCLGHRLFSDARAAFQGWSKA